MKHELPAGEQVHELPEVREQERNFFLKRALQQATFLLYSHLRVRSTGLVPPTLEQRRLFQNRDAPVAQLDRVSDSDSEGHWFESSRAYQLKNP